MKYPGRFKNGVVLLDSPVPFQDGTVVTVEAAAPDNGPVGKRLKRFAGKLKDLPGDMARNHDHYLHGRPKR